MSKEFILPLMGILINYACSSAMCEVKWASVQHHPDIDHITDASRHSGWHRRHTPRLRVLNPIERHLFKPTQTAFVSIVGPSEGPLMCFLTHFVADHDLYNHALCLGQVLASHPRTLLMLCLLFRRIVSLAGRMTTAETDICSEWCRSVFGVW